MKAFPRVTEISAKHSVEQLLEAKFLPVQAELKTIEDGRLSLENAPLPLEMLGMHMSNHTGKPVNTLLVRHYNRRSNHFDRDYTPRRSQSNFAGRIALVAFSGAANFMLHDGYAAYATQLEPGTAIYYENDAVRWISPPLTDDILTTVTFAHDTSIDS